VQSLLLLLWNGYLPKGMAWFWSNLLFIPLRLRPPFSLATFFGLRFLLVLVSTLIHTSRMLDEISPLLHDAMLVPFFCNFCSWPPSNIQICTPPPPPTQWSPLPKGEGFFGGTPPHLPPPTDVLVYHIGLLLANNVAVQNPPAPPPKTIYARLRVYVHSAEDIPT